MKAEFPWDVITDAAEAGFSLPRLFYQVQLSGENGEGECYADDGNPDYLRDKAVRSSDANLVSSRIAGGTEANPDGQDLHAPAIDIDLPCRIVPSSTPGHGHLYIDFPMPWRDYELLLRTMAMVGLVEPGYADASIAHGASFLRKPGVKRLVPRVAPTEVLDF